MASHQTVETPVEQKLPVSTTNEKNTTTHEQVQRAQWLRAAIMGASDGLLSTTSLMLGVGAVKEDRWSMVLSGIAGAVAGACSMAVGEFVSVSTQRDIEKVTLSKSSTSNAVLGEKDVSGQIKANIPENPTRIIESNLTISVELTPSRRSIPCENARCEPSEKIGMKINAIEMSKQNDGGEEDSLPSPHKAASASALAFLCGSLVPLMSAILIAQCTIRIVVVVVATSIALALFGGLGALIGGSPARPSAVRVLVGGWIAMAITYGLLKPFEKESRNDKGVM